MRAPIVLSLFLSLGSSIALAGPFKAAPQAQMPQLDKKQIRMVVRAHTQERMAGLAFTSRFFKKVAVDKDFTGEHVLHHDRHAGGVTAFLDMSDPMHPRHDPEVADEDENVQKIPAAKRAHILVVPNTPREHIGPTVSGKIRLEDTTATSAIFAAAHKLAKDLGIKNPDIYANTSDRIGVGYFHVHIVGERGAAYPKLTSP